VLAVAGVLLLARHHPDVVARDAGGRPVRPAGRATDPLPSAEPDADVPLPDPVPPDRHTDQRRPWRPFPRRRP
ncbi:MAG: hypothetical protein M3235_10880, partial [Actinomycetota bacterium]|nr:hypothetical protein [Actinomycetota bacterium]